MAHTELGRAIFARIKQELVDVSKVERDAKMEGRRMTLVLQPEHKSGKSASAPAANKVPGLRASAPMTAGAGLNISQPAQAAAG